MNRKISVIGLGYVGLPVAVAFGKKYAVVGFDISEKRIEELKRAHDHTREIEDIELKEANILYTSDAAVLKQADFHIVAVPTPIDASKRPDLRPLLSASKLVGQQLKRGDIVVYESTVYPGSTEEDCVPVLEAESGLKCGADFHVGYSPERINPGDKEHTFTKIKKVISSQASGALDIIASVYESVVVAGVHRTGSIRAAEAAKVIENTQRDLNIALINELSLIFKKLGIDTEEVLEAAATKWNFLPFRPGLVGGHCIGVDPYYLTHKATQVGLHPEMILAGRRLNDSMAYLVADQITKLMTKKRIHVVDAKILIMGLTFKENCSDLRNTRIIDIIRTFESYNCYVDVYDPWIDKDEALEQFDITPIHKPEKGVYDAIVMAVAHSEFKNMSAASVREFGKDNHILFDVKYIFNAAEVDGRL